MDKVKRGRGRPPKPPKERAEKRFEMRVNPSDKAAWKAAADEVGQTLAEWIKANLNRAAKREPNKD